MKTLKYILFVVLALFVIFLLFGLLSPVVHYGHEISVNKPLNIAWAVNKDASKFDQWLQGFQSVELISGKQDEIGSKYKVVVNPGEGQEDFEMIQTLVGFKEYELVDMHYDSDMMIFKQKIHFAGDDNNATVRTESTVEGKGLLMRSMFAVMGKLGSFQSQEEINVNNLQKLIEANTTDYYPVEEEEASTPLSEQEN